MNNDLIVISLKAHLDFLCPRIYSDNKAKDFLKEMKWWINEYKDLEYIPSMDDLDLRPIGNTEGTNLALDIVNDIVYSINKRFNNKENE